MTKRHKRTLIWVLSLLLASAAGYTAYYFTSLYNQVSGLQKVGESSPFRSLPVTETAKVPEPPKWEGSEPVNILLMGVDSRGSEEDEIPRSDSMIVASIDPDKKTINMFSIMRDTYTDIPDHGKQRINAAITHGPNVAMQTVSDLLGIPIQYYVYTDFQGFIKLVDAVGGVDFYVEKDMKYLTTADGPQYDIDLKEGQQHLDGTTALQYVRFRHDRLSDFTRTGRQREFLQAIADKLKTSTSIMNLPNILEQVSPYIDTNMSVGDMWKLATVAYDSSMGGSEQIPPNPLLREVTIDGAAVLTVSSEEKLKQFIQDTLNAPAEEQTPADADPNGSGGEETPGGTSPGEEAPGSVPEPDTSAPKTEAQSPETGDSQ
ncbi:LCP family protein [Saccharibacillus sp. CPCC 101409]|uniref:LCP family protein n=1 Tax=Saccharibacillus sp. CPCC 101409 TaxID=3058041 RepID=UPI0026733567|nr:LCP family protein [Saccharibacillus sp. CPCC 101409]MDO3412676.1 LCP family protein [Saccharibacillus sp. CPCC 101409]